MNILFVCKYNGERSQIAEAFFRKLDTEHSVLSVGTHADERKGLPLQETAIRSMREIGIELNTKDDCRTQLTRELIEGADYIISLTVKDDLPEFALQHPGLILWDVPAANHQPYGDFYRERRDQIKQLVEQFAVEELRLAVADRI